MSIESPKNARLHWYHWFIVAASLVLTLFAWHISKTQTEEKLKQRFEFQSSQLLELIQERMSRYEDALRSGVAVIYSQSHGINVSEWRQFAETLKIHESYPGINGIGVIFYVQPSALEAYLDKERTVRPDFRIHPQHQRGEYWPITYIEPVATNAKAVGLDIAFEDNRYQAATLARDSNSTQITAPIVLVQDEKQTPGFLQYVPFYNGNKLDTLQQRQQNFVGHVYAPFIMYKLMEGTLEQKNRQLVFRVTDTDQVLYDELEANNPHYDPTPMYTKEVTAEMYGRPWRYQIQTAMSFRQGADTMQSSLILIGGITIDCLLLFLFITLARSNQRAVTLADKLTHKLKVRETYFRHIIESAPCGIIIVNHQGAIETLNPTALRLFELTPDTNREQAFSDLIAPQQRTYIAGLMQQFLQGQPQPNQTQSFEIVCQRQNGQQYPAEIGFARFEGEDGAKLLTTVMDMSQYAEITDELKRSNKELKDFAYVASHDLKAPLKAIMQLATWIREDLKDMADADSLQNLNLLNSRTKRLESLLDDLLAYSRIGRQADELRMVDLNSMLNAIFGLNDHPKGFNLQIKTPLPTFETLAIPLEVIFRNLLINAVKHHDKPQGVVTVTFHDGGELYHFTVCDDGPGIDPEFHQKIFELFKTLKPRDEVEGSGMGLSIVKKMVEFYGGEIEVNSDGKHGSCFSFSWPKQIVVQD